MKMKFLTVYVALISTTLLAQQDTNTPSAAPTETPAAPPAVTAPAEATNPPTMAPETPAAAAPEQTNAPAAEPARKKPHHKKKPTTPASEMKTVPLVSGSAVVAVSPRSHVNVRGQAGLKGEIIGRMTNGEPVTVIEEIRLKKSLPDEPSVWAKIVLPDKAHPWVKASYIDSATMTVKPKTLNLRGGPGENYSVLGSLRRGDSVKEINTKEGWMQVETKNAFAFMAAQYLTQDPVALAAAAGMSSPTNNEMIAESQTAVDSGTNSPDMSDMTNNMAMNGTNDLSNPTNTVVEPPPPRIVEREGFVRGATSIQAPTEYELISLDNHQIIDYLYTKSNELDLSRYKGLHIIVTGVEGLDERWKSTPLITVQRIQVIE